MIEFPLLLIGYALLPIVAFQLMIMADRPQQKGEQNAFRRSKSCKACGGSARHEQSRRLARPVSASPTTHPLPIVQAPVCRTDLPPTRAPHLVRLAGRYGYIETTPVPMDSTNTADVGRIGHVYCGGTSGYVPCTLREPFLIEMHFMANGRGKSLLNVPRNPANLFNSLVLLLLATAGCHGYTPGGNSHD